MTWLQRYKLRHFVRNSIWFSPLCGMVAALVLVRLLHGLEEAMGWVSPQDADTMRAVLGTLAGSMFTLIVFVCSSLLLVVQLASAQLSPRIVGVLFRDPVTRLTLTAFVFTFAFAIGALVRIDDTVPRLTAEIAAYGSAVCIALFLYMIDHVSRLLRPSGALHSVASVAHQVIDSVYPCPLSGAPAIQAELDQKLREGAVRTIVSPQDGVVLAFDMPGLVALGARYHCVIELAPQVGNFVAQNYPLFRVRGGNELPPAAAHALCQSIALGRERTIEQDPAYAFRLIVDIASKALSPAINDPTTAVLALDRIHHLLRHVGGRRLDDERVRDPSGHVRLIFRTPNWEDFVTLAVTEIRQFGGGSIQVARRMRAMLEDLVRFLPAERAAPLERELKLLKQTAERLFPEPEDRAFADISDDQGVGGTQEKDGDRA